MLFYESILRGKNDKAYRTHKEEYKKAYKDIGTNMSQMTMALQKVNLPEEIEACGYRYYLKSLADVELRNYTEVIETLTPITNTIEDNYLKRPLISAFVKSGKYVELQEYLSDYALNSSSQDIDYLRGFAGVQLINSNQSERAIFR